ncbi:MAG TPA: hypothetical protein PLF11_15710 [Bacillota bacterium]|jgi:hypothetical protein|nr:hypothetical protein [Bacillota bacterium]
MVRDRALAMAVAVVLAVAVAVARARALLLTMCPALSAAPMPIRQRGPVRTDYLRLVVFQLSTHHEAMHTLRSAGDKAYAPYAACLP